MDELSVLAASGEWWTTPWWDKPGAPVPYPCPKEQLAQSADILKRYFDAPWARDLAERPRRNLVFPNLCIGGTMSALQFVVYLAEMLQALESAEGLARVVAALKGEKSESAFLEVEAAYAFALADYSVQFPAEGGKKSADVLVELGEVNLAIECKRLQPEAWEKWEDDLTKDLIRALPGWCTEQNLSVSVALNTRLTQVCMSDSKNPELNEAFRRAIVQVIDNAVSDALAKGDIPVEFYVNEVAHVRVASQTKDELGQVCGMEPGSPAVTRRILQNGVIRACEQLPVGAAGVVFVYSKLLPEPQFFRTFFDAVCAAKRDALSQLVAVVLCPLQTTFHRASPIIFSNAQTRFPTCRPKILDVLTSKFGGTVISEA